MQDAHLRWARGGEARLVAIGADTVSIVSTVPSPPGSRIEGDLVDGGGRVKVKIHASKRREDGTFALEGRPLDLTREMREKLVALAAGQ